MQNLPLYGFIWQCFFSKSVSPFGGNSPISAKHSWILRGMKDFQFSINFTGHCRCSAGHQHISRFCPIEIGVTSSVWPCILFVWQADLLTNSNLGDCNQCLALILPIIPQIKDQLTLMIRYPLFIFVAWQEMF